MQQVANIEEIFREFFKEFIPDRIIEIGTGTIEFTNIIYNLRLEINDQFEFITIDQFKSFTDTDLPWDAVFMQMNFFAHVHLIGEMIVRNTLVLCDNGNKIEEVWRLYPRLKNNCVIMAHDYCETQEDIGKYWGCCEITWDDVKDLKLTKYQYDLMKTAAWLSLKTNI